MVSKATRNSLDALCARAEALQTRLFKGKDKSEANRRIYEALSDAKNRLLDAISVAEGGRS